MIKNLCKNLKLQDKLSVNKCKASKCHVCKILPYLQV